MLVFPNTYWLYTGDEDHAINTEHIVLLVAKREDGVTEVTTWTDPCSDMGIHGLSWHGTMEDFLNNFIPAEEV